MHKNQPLDPETLVALQRIDTCTLANAIEMFGSRMHNEGYTDASIRCLFPRLPAMLGYAVTLRIRCSTPPPDGHPYEDRTDWWPQILKTPAPRIVVIQDVDKHRGAGTFIGEVHANILRAHGCVGVVTDGAVRDVPAVEPLGFHLFADSVSASHAYAHIVDVNEPVEVGGLAVAPGDLLHGDVHGVLSVPRDIAAEIPAAAAKIIERDRRIIALCQQGTLAPEKLRDAVRELYK